MDTLAKSVQDTVRIGLRNTRRLVEMMPVKTDDGIAMSVWEFKANCVMALKKLEDEEFLK